LYLICEEHAKVIWATNPVETWRSKVRIQECKDAIEDSCQRAIKCEKSKWRFCI